MEGELVPVPSPTIEPDGAFPEHTLASRGLDNSIYPSSTTDSSVSISDSVAVQPEAFVILTVTVCVPTKARLKVGLLFTYGTLSTSHSYEETASGEVAVN